MKTSNAISKPTKTSEDKVKINKKKVTIRKLEPSEEDIHEKARDIYHQRIDRGDHVSAVHDWIEAEEWLRDSDF